MAERVVWPEVKTNSPQAEHRRVAARSWAKTRVLPFTPIIAKWAATAGDARLHEAIEQMNLAIAREEQYVRIIKSMGRPKKATACRTCAVRKLRLSKKTKEKPANVAECRKIIASIEECWPGWRKVPEVLWNQYIDSAGHCRCGRVIAPKLVSKSANVRYCCAEHRQNELTKKNRARRKEYAIASKALSEGME
jgi:hypothetical protein